MAFRVKKHVKPEIEIPTASLADIVFLLLIFFLVSTSMNPDSGLGLTLPPLGEEVKINPENILNIFVNEEGKILIDESIVELSDVKNIVKEKIAANDKLIVSVQTAQKASYKMMIDVLDEVKLANAPRISLATPQF
ncbi:biopolymer transporter ExbD [bacterium]|nr:biopolymer transporter ExbD [bacterium]